MRRVTHCACHATQFLGPEQARPKATAGQRWGLGAWQSFVHCQDFSLGPRLWKNRRFPPPPGFEVACLTDWRAALGWLWGGFGGALVEPWWSLGGALVEPWGGFVVALYSGVYA